MVDDRIFVQIPAYRDRELSATLLDLYRRAARPSQLRTVVVWQHDDEETLDRRVRRLPGLEVIDVLARDSAGCNWARQVSRQQWTGEPFTLLLDSHHRFVPGWDDLLRGMYGQLRAAGVPKPLLTGYLPAYDPARDPLGRRHHPTWLRPASRVEGVLTGLVGDPIPNWRSLDAPLPARFLSLHLVFAAGEFNDEVAIDPDLYFTGDEVLVGMRAFIAGYDLYHPHRVVGWHSYDRTTRVAHWTDHAGSQHRRSDTVAALRAAFSPRPSHTCGTRTVADYEAYIAAPLVEAVG